MAQVIAIYSTPNDPAAFDRYYRETHIPIARKIPGLRSYSISKGPLLTLAGSAPYLVAVLDFASMADIQAALMSPEAQAAAADVQNFATGGVTLVAYDTEMV
jgi:uncharacterized protein (TIGR02118 family)